MKKTSGKILAIVWNPRYSLLKLYQTKCDLVILLMIEQKSSNGRKELDEDRHAWHPQCVLFGRNEFGFFRNEKAARGRELRIQDRTKTILKFRATSEKSRDQKFGLVTDRKRTS